MLGLLLENGPLLVTENGSLRANNASWANLVDYVFVDQPVYVPNLFEGDWLLTMDVYL